MTSLYGDARELFRVYFRVRRCEMNPLKYLYDIQSKIKVKINDVDVEGFFFNEKIGVQDIICFYTKTLLPVGSIVKYNSKSYMITNMENDYNGVCYVYYLDEMNYIVKFGKNSDASTCKSVLGILKTKLFYLNQSDVLSASVNTLTFICAKSEFTYSVDSTFDLIALRGMYKIVGIDTSIENIITFTCEKVAKSEGYDYAEVFDVPVVPPVDPVDPIDPEPPTPTDNYVIVITGNNRPYTTQSVVYTASITNNDVVVTDKTVDWTIDNATFTFVEKNATTCKVKAPSTALVKANLRATLTDKPEVFVDYAIESKRM